MLEVACSRHVWHGRLRVPQLIEQHGADMRLLELRYIIADDCPRVIAERVYDHCDRPIQVALP